MPDRFDQVRDGRRAGPVEVEIHAACLSLDERRVAQFLEGVLHIVAGQRALDASQTGILAAPLTCRARSEIGAGDDQPRKADAVVEFDETPLHLCELALAPVHIRSVKIDGRNAARIGGGSRAAGILRGGVFGRVEMQALELQVPRLAGSASARHGDRSCDVGSSHGDAQDVFRHREIQ